MIKKIRIVLCLFLIFACLSSCSDKIPSLDNESDWIVVFKDERADPPVYEAKFSESHIWAAEKITFKYKYVKGEKFVPEIKLRYKDNKTYYTVKATTEEWLDPIWGDWEMADVTKIGTFRVKFEIYENEDSKFSLDTLGIITIIVESLRV